MFSIAHEQVRQFAGGRGAVTALARKLGIPVNSLRYVLAGSQPKVDVALAIERVLGIPTSAWVTPSREHHNVR